jgi:hypothetical protein
MRYLYIEHFLEFDEFIYTPIEFIFSNNFDEFKIPGLFSNNFNEFKISSLIMHGNGIFTGTSNNTHMNFFIIDLDIFSKMKDKPDHIVRLINLAYQDNRSKKLKNILG